MLSITLRINNKGSTKRRKQTSTQPQEDLSYYTDGGLDDGKGRQCRQSQTLLRRAQ